MSTIFRWISEKMDGVRAYWDGQRLLSKRGKDLGVPLFFTSQLPSDISLDGELWMGRGTYEQLMSLLNSSQQDWSSVEYCIFDAPSSNLPHKERIQYLKQLQLPAQVSSQKCCLTFVDACCGTHTVQGDT